MSETALKLRKAEYSALIQPFYPALDGLRALAFFAVCTFHYYGSGFGWLSSTVHWGWIGVDVFFVLSGFLITGILYDSLPKQNFFRNFYTRRALRIFPLYYGLWLFLLLMPLIRVNWNRYVVSMVFYLGNIFIAGGEAHLHSSPVIFTYRHISNSSIPHGINLDHLWSLCVEEQFYLVWRAVVWLVRSRIVLLRICLAIIALAPVGRTLYLHLQPHSALYTTETLYYSTLPRIDTLLWGSAIALWLRNSQMQIASIRRAAIAACLIAPLILAACIALEPHEIVGTNTDPVVVTIGYTLVAIFASGILLLCLDSSTWLASGLQSRPLIALGRISYGLYFFHQIVFATLSPKAAQLREHLGVFAPLVPLLCTIVVAYLSFRFYESRFLKLKEVLAPRPGAVSDPPPDGPLAA